MERLAEGTIRVRPGAGDQEPDRRTGSAAPARRSTPRRPVRGPDARPAPDLRHLEAHARRRRKRRCTRVLDALRAGGRARRCAPRAEGPRHSTSYRARHDPIFPPQREDRCPRSPSDSKPGGLLCPEPQLALRLLHEGLTKEAHSITIDDFADLFSPGVESLRRRHSPHQLADRVRLLRPRGGLPHCSSASAYPGCWGRRSTAGSSLPSGRFTDHRAPRDASPSSTSTPAGTSASSNLEGAVNRDDLEAAEEVATPATATRHQRDHRRRLHRHEDQARTTTRWYRRSPERLARDQTARRCSRSPSSGCSR